MHSNSFQLFPCLCQMGQYPSSSTLQENIKPLSEETWEAIHLSLMQYARKAGIENGRKIRIDSTAIDSDVHDPTDASLLWDGVRIITRWLEEGHALTPRPDYRYSNHLRVVKKRHLAVVNAKKEEDRALLTGI